MLLIPCPCCGERPEHEFVCGGPAHVVRPTDPASTSDAEWTAYLFLRRNPRGPHRERWQHVHGCRQWFNVERHTVDHRILRAYPLDEHPPADAL
jgi:heterotetrameric sarcosine oxidase delta subunit